MARLARVVVPGIPHHVVQRGNRRQPTFFQDSDYQLYLDLLLEWSQAFGVQVWSYCLMTNHVHLIVVPERESSLAAAIGEVHRRYSRSINFRMGWRGHLWQGRFHSFPMDENYLLASARYVEHNPVKAGMVNSPGEYPWSSARHHLGICSDPLLGTSPLTELVTDWEGFLSSKPDEVQEEDIRRSERSGRPIGAKSFIDELEKQLNRRLRKMKPGPKRAN